MTSRICFFASILITLFLVAGCTSTKRSAFNTNLSQTPGNMVNSCDATDHLLGRLQAASCEEATGWIWPDHLLEHDPINYSPREGDVLLMTSRSPWYVGLYALGRAGHPLHMGLIVRRSDGSLAILESGGSDDKRVTLLPVTSRLNEYVCANKDPLVWIRPIRIQLTAEQSNCLTAFSESQVGKEFGTLRSAMFVLPGKPKLTTTSNQENWFCSELTTQALKHAGIIRGIPRPAAVLPEDYYHNRDIDLNFGWFPSLVWTLTNRRPDELPLLAPLRPE